MRLILVTLVALTAMAITAQPLAAALVVNGYTPATAGKYDRFANDDAFIGSAYDWSGVGRTSGGYWGVLISPSFMLSARHFKPRTGETVRFYHSNNPAGGYDERVIGSSDELTGTGLGISSDLVLTRLDSPTTGVATYAIGNPATNLIGKELYVWGQAGNEFDIFLRMRLGRNEVTEIRHNFSSDPLVGQGDVIAYDYNTSTGLGPDEAMVAPYDSGGPSFIIGPDGPELVGTHWFQSGELTPGGLPGSGDTLVTSFINQLNSAMAATGSSERVTVAAVPEPNSLGLVLAGLSVVLIRRRQRAA